MTMDRTLLHQLWTKAVGTPSYDKEQWVRLETHLKEFERITKEMESSPKRHGCQSKT